MALGTTLPVWPALIFTYLEPISLIIGYHAAFFSPSTFVTRQLPVSPLNPLNAIVPDTSQIVSLSLANIFLLLGGVAILCTAITKEARVTKWYLIMVACGDIGHIYAGYSVMGPKVFWDFANYNDMMWGNVGLTVFLHVNRLATLAGVFGSIVNRR